MPYIVVENFKGGLDTRRHKLSSAPGTLTSLVNAHVTRGGEIEKRKAFHLAYALPAGTFGLETGSGQVYVFGSADLAAQMPAGVTYQRLVSPDGATNSMTKVIYSTVYGGKPFVIAQFDDGERYPFWDGAFIKDFSSGIVTAAMMNNAGIAAHLASVFSYTNDENQPYSIQVINGNKLRIIGPPGVAFEGSMIKNSDPAVDGVVVQPKTDATAVNKSKGSFTILRGSANPAKLLKDSRNMSAASLPGIRSIRVGASAPDQDDGLDLIAFGGAEEGLKYLTAPGITYDPGSNWGHLCWQIANAINSNTTNGLAHGYSAHSYVRARNSGNDTNTLLLYAPAALGADANGTLVQMEFDANPAGVYELSHLVDPATIAVSPYDPDRFIATMGQLGVGSNFYGSMVGTTNAIKSVTVDGVDVLGSSAGWVASNSALASLVVSKINTYLSSTEYTASVSNSSTVEIEALAGTGASPNGRTIYVDTEGTVTVGSFIPFSGGTDLVQSAPQIMDFEIKDPFTVGDKYSIIIVDPASPNQPYQFGFNRVGGVQPLFSATYKGKEYLASGSTLYFSKLNDATKWGVYELGSGFIDMSNNFGGREDLTGFGAYQGMVAVFTRRNSQLWFFDPNPAQNAQRQILDNTGCIAPGSVVSVGAIDLFYLADNGIRSLRARENTDAAYANDIGSPVDQLVIEHMRTMTDADKYDAKAVIEPEDGRYWLALGSRLFVLSSFAGSGINAWSEYDPGFTVEEFASMENKVYARSHDDKIYIYGGNDGTLYDASPVSVEIPYLDANKPATFKSVNGLDVTCEGGWKFFIGFDYTNPTAKDEIASMDQPSFSLGRIPVAGYGTHVGVKAVTTGSGYAKLANAIVHYDDQHSKHEAG
jgi:hypothetical protein